MYCGGPLFCPCLFCVLYAFQTLIGTFFFRSWKLSYMIFLKIFFVPLTWVSFPFSLPINRRFVLSMVSPAPWVFCAQSILFVCFNLTFIQSCLKLPWFSLPWLLLCRCGFTSEVFMRLPKFFVCNFITVWVFFSDSVSTFMSRIVSYISSFYHSFVFL